MFADEIVREYDTRMRSINALTAKRAALNAIIELSHSVAWPEYLKQLMEIRTYTVEKMLAIDVSDRERAELAAEARILKTIAVSEDRAKHQINQIDEEIKKQTEEVKRLQTKADLARTVNRKD